MDFGLIYKRVINLIINPKSEWENIKLENISKKDAVKKYAIPLILLLTISTFLGNLFYTSRLTIHPLYPLISAAAMFIIVYAGTYLSAILINELTSSFNSKKNLNATFTLVIHSLTAFFIFTSLAYVLPEPFYEVRYFGIYSLYLFWLGSSSLLDTPVDNKVGFTFVSTLIILGIYAVLSMVFSRIIGGIFGLGLIEK
ncbi:MAG TPA: Yip1 family protein [Bacteroidales bacterium]|nr:Yip1 family protein [Bacteroidales bacterium]